MPMLKQAMELAKKYHKGQKDKSGSDYFETHIKGVVNILSVDFGVVNDDILCTGALHDILEDTTATAETLKATGFSDSVIEAVKLLTRDVSDMKYYQRIAQNIAATMVKIADMTNNTDIIRLDKLDAKIAEKLLKKYQKGIKMMIKYNSNIETIGNMLLLQKNIENKLKK